MMNAPLPRRRPMIGLVVCFHLDMSPLSAPVLCALRHAGVKQVMTLGFNLDWK